MRFRARLAALRGQTEEVESGFKGAVGLFREIAVPFYMAVTLLERAEWLVAQSRTGHAAPYPESFHRLRGATPTCRATASLADRTQDEVARQAMGAGP